MLALFLSRAHAIAIFPNQCLQLGVLTCLEKSRMRFQDLPLSEVAPGRFGNLGCKKCCDMGPQAPRHAAGDAGDAALRLVVPYDGPCGVCSV